MGTRCWKDEWAIDGEVTYLNHGSFGPSPRVVQDKFIAWSRRIESQPMRFFLREMEQQFDSSLAVLGRYLNTAANNLIFVENATVGMNVVAQTVKLDADDEVLTTDHEYGAVIRLWKKVCQDHKARLVTCELPFPLDNRQEIAERLLSQINSRTKLIVLSHVTSPTAVELPIDLICEAARERGVAVCIDGPHAVGMLPINLKRLNCDFYTASCHKWLSSCFGSGFLYVSPRQQKHARSPVVSWGGSIGGRQPSWKDEFQWLGTRNPAAFYSIQTAIEFFNQPVAGSEIRSAQQAAGKTTTCQVEVVSSSSDQQVGSAGTVFELFRQHSKGLLSKAQAGIRKLSGLPAIDCDSFGGPRTMVACEIAPNPDSEFLRDPLMDALAEKHHIEVPVVTWNGRRLLRVSAHLYNSEADIDRLLGALDEELSSATN